jgi:hypothetical protein
MTPQERQRNAINLIHRLTTLKECTLHDERRAAIEDEILAVQELLRAAQITTILLDHLSTITEEASVANHLGDNDLYNEVLP